MKIVVAGAGIAGLAAALALSRPGRDVTVLERRTGFGETGAGIQLGPNATRVLQGLGLGPALARLACEPDRIVIRDLSGGREIGAVALGPAMRERYGAPYLTVARADLHTALLDAARGRPSLRLRVGRGLVAAEARPSGLAVATEAAGGAREELEADLLIGADGLWSRARALAGDPRRPRPTGYAAYRALARADALAPALRQEGGLWLGPRRHLVHYPIAAGRAVNVVLVARRGEPMEGWSTAVSADEVAAALGEGFAPALRDLIGAAEGWSAWSLFDLPARRLGAGRIALVGDAGHPILPYLAQGGSLGIEDAAALAAALAEAGEDAKQAVRAYARERTPRVRRVGREARRNGLVYHLPGPLALARNLALRRLGPDGLARRYGWLYGWRPPEAAGA